MRFIQMGVVILAITFAATLFAAEPVSGWRGNQTGLWPDSTAPWEWGRIPHGAIEGLRCSATRPQDADAKEAEIVEKGLLRQWLVLGPFPVQDSEKDFDESPIGDETAIQPTAGEKIGNREWTPLTGPFDDPSVFGTAAPPALDIGKAVGFQINQLAYAHTYVHSPRGGKARIVGDHGEGLKVWVNGLQVYRNAKREMALGTYPNLSRLELEHLHAEAARMEIELQPGWNRVLLKVSSPRVSGHNDMRVQLRIMDPPDVQYESRNIRWMAELPARSTSTPILVGDRLFVAAEPDQLLCFDRTSGKRLWAASVNYYEALPKAEKARNPEYAT